MEFHVLKLREKEEDGKPVLFFEPVPICSVTEEGRLIPAPDLPSREAED